MQMNLEKRKHPRLLVAYECFASSQGKNFSGLSHDISPYGIGLFSNDEFQPNSKVDLNIFVPNMNVIIEARGEVVYCIEKPQGSPQSPRRLVGIKFTEGPLENFSVTDSMQQTSRHTPSHTLAISADPAACYKMLADFERYPEWAGGVDEARVLERYPDGRGRRVEFLHDFILRKVRYILDYTYDDENNILSWKSVGGDEEIVSITGRYVFKPGLENNSSATYELDITLSLVPSKKLVRYVTAILMRKEMKNFKGFVEKSTGKAQEE